MAKTAKSLYVQGFSQKIFCQNKNKAQLINKKLSFENKKSLMRLKVMQR
jgi:hypothetical protein